MGDCEQFTEFNSTFHLKNISRFPENPRIMNSELIEAGQRIMQESVENKNSNLKNKYMEVYFRLQQEIKIEENKKCNLVK
jgi:hypothetical protein